jgi:hypothetical protein
LHVWGKLNIFFTLAAGLLCLKLYKEKNNDYIVIILIITYLLKIDYSIFGVISILLFYKFKDNFKLTLISQAILWLCSIAIYSPYQILGALSVFII